MAKLSLFDRRRRRVRTALRSRAPASRGFRSIVRAGTSMPRSSTMLPARRSPRLRPSTRTSRARPARPRTALRPSARRSPSAPRRPACRGRVRPWRLPVPWPGEGPRRRCPRRRTGVLNGDENQTNEVTQHGAEPARSSPRRSAPQRPQQQQPRPPRGGRRGRGGGGGRGRGGGDRGGRGRRDDRRGARRRRRWRRGADREARPHQPRLQDREGRQALRLRGARGRRRRQGPRRLRPRQGARSSGSDQQGDCRGEEGDDPRSAARRPHASP